MKQINSELGKEDKKLWARPQYLEEYYGLKTSWLESDRLRGGKDSIPFTKIRGLVLYHLPTVEEWLTSRMVHSTSDEVTGNA